MKNIVSDIGLYFRMIKLHFRCCTVYRGWSLMLLQTLFVVVTDPISVILLFLRFGDIGEWSVEKIILVYALAVASFGLAESFFRGLDYFPWRMVRTGNFDRLLLRPRPLILQAASSVFHLHRLPRPLTALAAVFWSLSRQGVVFTARNALILLSALLGGFIMYCGVFTLTSGLSFFTVKGLDWIYILTNASYQVVRCPEPYIPRTLKGMFSFLLPVLFISFYPAAAICGWGYPAWKAYLALPAGAAFFMLSVIVWKIGVRHYTSTGS